MCKEDKEQGNLAEEIWQWYSLKMDASEDTEEKVVIKGDKCIQPHVEKPVIHALNDWCSYMVQREGIFSRSAYFLLFSIFGDANAAAAV